MICSVCLLCSWLCYTVYKDIRVSRSHCCTCCMSRDSDGWVEDISIVTTMTSQGPLP
ncbi:hypothetical protein PISMIDRAFT_464652 [Pisolithus microcarpus 441]|uniref:Uncharacterized protein n=1 Tax=Pisolithus microcarpus 441 TaxID=765257 RepID=A0A0C9XIG1_9AGAM|nr:hypothetical protein PISMIDRAFT_464652 [Pisolithus microcarpus 441]